MKKNKGGKYRLGILYYIGNKGKTDDDWKSSLKENLKVQSPK